MLTWSPKRDWLNVIVPYSARILKESGKFVGVSDGDMTEWKKLGTER